MIRIDHISFDFAVPDEGFAQGLYAGWDGFCRRCFTQVAEECLAPYGEDATLYELERIDLDLGSIPEERFYDEYPRRLREALLAALPPLHISQGKESPERTAASRLANLLFLLEHGHPLPEWADKGFDLQKETERLPGLSSPTYTKAVTGMASLVASKEHALRRLLWQGGSDRLLSDLFAALLTLPSAGTREKRRVLSIVLETRPDIPLRFIHGAQGDEELRGMAELLESPSVRVIMRNETEEHAEVDLPPYWHYLYEWLIRHYPFNGLAIFGGKAEFKRHLHHRLLTFIRKRHPSYYLSKAELTVSFLREVFGDTYYIDVLNAIYELQPHNPDGSPVHDNYFNRELYRMFLQLSLLRLPASERETEGINEGDRSFGISRIDNERLTAVMKDTSYGDGYKRMLLALLVKEQPATLVEWLRKVAATEKSLLRVLAGLMDERTVRRLVASVSLAAMEAMERVRNYLDRHKGETAWMKDITNARWETTFRQSALSWLADAEVTDRTNAGDFPGMVYREITGNKDDATVAALRKEIEKEARMFADVDAQDREPNILRLRRLLSDQSVSEAERRRAVARFWDVGREDYAQAVQTLHDEGLLRDVIRQTSHHALPGIILQTARQAFDTGQAASLLPLLEWLMAHREVLSPYPQDANVPLAERLLVWIVSPGNDIKDVHSLLADLFGESGIQTIQELIVKDASLYGDAEIDRDTMLALLQAAPTEGTLSPHARYARWLKDHETTARLVRTLLENQWQTAEGFMEWLDGTATTNSDKRGTLRMAMTECPQEYATLLRALPKEGKAIETMAGYLPATTLLQGIGRSNFHQAAVLERFIGRIRQDTRAMRLIPGVSMDGALSKALLLYMRDADATGKTLTEAEIIAKFLGHLHFAVTGKTESQADAEWKGFFQEATISIFGEKADGNVSDRNDVKELLTAKDIGDTELRHRVETILHKRPEWLLAWIEAEAQETETDRMAQITDMAMLAAWFAYLPTVSGFAHADSFRRLSAWLLRLVSCGEITVRDLASAVYAWVRLKRPRPQDAEGIETFFLSRLFHSARSGGETILPMECLTDAALPETMRKRLLKDFILLRPDALADFMRRSIRQDGASIGQWAEWLTIGDLERLVASISLSMAELARQVFGALRMDDKTRHSAWISLTARYEAEAWRYNTPRENVRTIVETLCAIQGKATEETRETLQAVLEELHVSETEEASAATADTPTDFMPVGNAGLCLLAPWFVRLFAMLGYMEEGKRTFKDTASKVRAVFLLQYLACGEEREWREPELVFNRLLTALSGNIPLPKRLTLTGEEMQTADSMVEGVKANWPKMDGTSVEGFRQSFILRDGIMEEEEGRWLLTVEEKAYDVLLDTVPWGFRQIRLPWLKKCVQVKWHEKQEF